MLNKTTNTIIKRPIGDDKSLWWNGAFAMIKFEQNVNNTFRLDIKTGDNRTASCYNFQNNYLIVAHSILFRERLCLYRFRLRVPGNVIYIRYTYIWLFIHISLTIRTTE